MCSLPCFLAHSNPFQLSFQCFAAFGFLFLLLVLVFLVLLALLVAALVGRRRTLTFAGARVLLVLGLLLAVFPRSLVALLGAPQTDETFYASLLGAVLIGIGLALTIEFIRHPRLPAGLGLLARPLCRSLGIRVNRDDHKS